MQDYTIGESFTLPSNGKIYPFEINPVFELKSMTTNHEMRRLSHSENPYLTMCEIMDDCTVNNPGISAYDLCLGDYQFLLHKLRVVTYGSEYKMQSTCPICGSTTNTVLNLDELEPKKFTEDLLKYSSFKLPRTNKEVKILYQTPRLQDAITKATRERQSKETGVPSDFMLLETLLHIIDTIDGKKPNPIKLEDWIRNLPMMDTNIILQNSQKYTEGIGLNMSFNQACSVCGLVYKSNFRATPEFFGPSMD